MAYTIEQIKSALSHVVYPESNKDIVSLNMVENITIDNNKVKFTLVLPKPNNPFKSSILRACTDVLKIYLNKEINLLKC